MTCLSDPQKRRQYDQVGSAAAFEQKEKNNGGGGGHPFDGANLNPEDIFNHFFFGADLPRQGRRPQQQR